MKKRLHTTVRALTLFACAISASAAYADADDVFGENLELYSQAQGKAGTPLNHQISLTAPVPPITATWTDNAVSAGQPQTEFTKATLQATNGTGGNQGICVTGTSVKLTTAENGEVSGTEWQAIYDSGVGSTARIQRSGTYMYCSRFRPTVSFRSLDGLPAGTYTASLTAYILTY